MYKNRRKNNLKITVLTTVILFLLILFLLFICQRLIISIVHTFVYLTGLTTLLLVSIFYISIILFFIRCIYKHYRFYRRSYLTIDEVSKLILNSEIKLLIYLFITFILLYLLYIVL